LQVFRLLSELERVESAVARKRTVEPRRAVTERERDLRRIARVFSSVDPDRNGGRARAPRATLNRPRVSRSHAPRPDRRAGRSRSPFSPAPSSPVSSPRASRATPSSSPASPSSSPSRSSWSSSSSSRVASQSGDGRVGGRRVGGRSRVVTGRSIGSCVPSHACAWRAGSVVTSRHSWCVPVPHTTDVAAWKGAGRQGVVVVVGRDSSCVRET